MIRIAVIPGRGRSAAQVAARREAQHADSIRAQCELVGVRAHVAHRPPRIEQRNRGVVGGTKAIAQHEGGDAQAIQPPGDLQTFMIGCQGSVAAARANHDAATVAAYRDVHRQNGHVEGIVSHGLWRSFRPQPHHFHSHTVVVEQGTNRHPVST